MGALMAREQGDVLLGSQPLPPTTKRLANLLLLRLLSRGTARTSRTGRGRSLIRTMATIPRPPPGYSSLAVSTAQILLPLTISNRCGQSFRWRGVQVYDEIGKEEPQAFHIKKEEGTVDAPLQHLPTRRSFCTSTEWSICLADRVVLVRQDEERGFLYHRTLLPTNALPERASSVEEETTAWLQDYLNLRVPLAELYEEWSGKDEVFARFAKRFTGVRMLRQDPWECLCA